MRTVLVLLLSILATAASHCGQAAIPFTFQALRSGKPVLGCARPRCFGWNTNGTRAVDTARFYKINGKEDGYLRRSDVTQRAPLRPGQGPQIAKCEVGYRQRSCGLGEWLGGISPFTDPTKPHFQIQCCSYVLLQDTEDRGVAPIKPGQVYIGGEVVEGTKLVAFDYISDVTKQILPDNSILYEVSVRRMPCTDEMEEVPEEIISNNALIQNLEGDIRVRQDAINQVIQPVSAPASPYGLQPRALAAEQTPFQQQPLQPLPEAQPASQAGQVQQQALPQPAMLQPQMGLFNQQMPLGLNGAMPGLTAPGMGMGLPQQQPYQPWFQNNIPQAPQSAQPAPAPQPAQPASQIAQVQQPPSQVPTPRQVQPQLSPQQQIPFMGQPAALPTMAPIPKLEDLPQIQIPSVEQVEEVIPPMQKAILTNIAKFFGVL